MIEDLKKKIDNMKKDNSSYKNYIKSFCESPKAIELFSKNEEFNSLKDNSNKKEKNKKEDEYF